MLKMSLTVFYFEYKLIDICYEVQALWCTKTKRALFFQYEWLRRHCESVNPTLIYGYINVHLETRYAPCFFSKYTSFYINDFKKPFILFLYLFAFFPLKKMPLNFLCEISTHWHESSNHKTKPKNQSQPQSFKYLCCKSHWLLLLEHKLFSLSVVIIKY